MLASRSSYNAWIGPCNTPLIIGWLLLSLPSTIHYPFAHPSYPPLSSNLGARGGRSPQQKLVIVLDGRALPRQRLLSSG